MSDYNMKCIWGKLYMRFYEGEISAETLQKLTASEQLEIDFDNLVLMQEGRNE